MNIPTFNIPVHFTTKYEIPYGSPWGAYFHLPKGSTSMLKNEIRTMINQPILEAVAGLNRGSLKHASGITEPPTAVDRERLYNNGINPLLVNEGGAFLFGDKLHNCPYVSANRMREYKIISYIEQCNGDIDTLMELKMDGYLHDFQTDVHGVLYVRIGRSISWNVITLLKQRRKAKLEKYYE